MATSWKLKCVTKLENYEDVRKVKTHMRQFGMVPRIAGIGSEVGPPRTQDYRVFYQQRMHRPGVWPRMRS